VNGGALRQLGKGQEGALARIGEQLVDDLAVGVGQLPVILLDDLLKGHCGAAIGSRRRECVSRHAGQAILIRKEYCKLQIAAIFVASV
jgi:hypothetical protein